MALKSFFALMVLQVAVASLLAAQIQLKSDPTTPGLSSGNAVAADFNGDGKLDLATLSFEGNVVIKLGRGNGFFQATSQVAFNNGGKLSYAGSWYSVSAVPEPIQVGHFVNGTALDVLDNYNLLPVITH